MEEEYDINARIERLLEEISKLESQITDLARKMIETDDEEMKSELKDAKTDLIRRLNELKSKRDDFMKWALELCYDRAEPTTSITVEEMIQKLRKSMVPGQKHYGLKNIAIEVSNTLKKQGVEEIIIPTPTGRE